ANGILICWPIIVGPSRGMLYRRNIAENGHFLLLATWRGDLAEKRIMSDLEDFDHVF
ncbi:hypothetical protein L9F63_015927, partial [Diploptera punctata]